jgi:ferredoxin
LSVEEDETVLAAALAAGWRWPSVCGGLAACGTCAFTVEEGAGWLTPIEAREQAKLNVLPARRTAPDACWRLACQSRVSRGGAIVIRKICTPPAE